METLSGSGPDVAAAESRGLALTARECAVSTYIELVSVAGIRSVTTRPLQQTLPALLRDSGRFC